MNITPRTSILIGVFIGLLVSALYVLGVVAFAQQPWKNACYRTLDSMTSGLSQYREFHVVTAPSSRNVLGWAGDPYCVVYR